MAAPGDMSGINIEIEAIKLEVSLKVCHYRYIAGHAGTLKVA
jgi:hypothetical protein